MITISNPLKLLINQQQAQSEQATKPVNQAKTEVDLATKLNQQRESALEGLTKPASSKHINKSLEEVFSDNDILALEAEPVETEPDKPETTEQAKDKPDKLDFVTRWQQTLKKYDQYASNADKYKSSYFAQIDKRVFVDDTLNTIDIAVYIWLASHSLQESAAIKVCFDVSVKTLIANFKLKRFQTWSDKVDNSLKKLKQNGYISLNETYKISNDQHFKIDIYVDDKNWSKAYMIDVDNIISQSDGANQVFNRITAYAVIKSYLWDTNSNTPACWANRTELMRRTKLSKNTLNRALEWLIDNQFLVSFKLRYSYQNGQQKIYYSDYIHLKAFKAAIQGDLESNKFNEIS
ncbi:MAG: hypothetical protein ABF695_12400 [Liquorilactobacillus ghanensis]|uniref:hypothetical protein n=1 Tax=Liquorilactobacillus ghanensis TaxID=399370 RepID=UPI0039ED77B0